MSERNLNRKTKAAFILATTSDVRNTEDDETGIAKGKIIFYLPGSKNAVKLALSKIILPSIGSVLWELKRQ
jgi:molybdopterin biosynthesis enzyme MoaB